MSSTLLLGLLPFGSTLLGGMAALRLRHRLHPFMAVAAGVLVATAIADLLPEAHALVPADAALQVGVAAVIGYIAFTAIEAFIHQASFEHGHPGEHEGGPRSAARRSPGLLAVLPPLSLILHSTLDGLAIGLGFQVGADVGVVVLLAVLAHDFADGMNVVTLTADAARGVRLAAGLLILDALAPVIGVGLSMFLTIPSAVLGLLLAAFAGVFIAIGAGHLLPEAQHRRPDHAPALVALSAAGAGAALLIRGIAG